MFDTLVQDGVKVLISNGLPVTCLYRLLTDHTYRDSLLEKEADLDVVAFFKQQFDQLSQRDQTREAGSALRRAHLLTFSWVAAPRRVRHWVLASALSCAAVTPVLIGVAPSWSVRVLSVSSTVPVARDKRAGRSGDLGAPAGELASRPDGTA